MIKDKIQVKKMIDNEVNIKPKSIYLKQVEPINNYCLTENYKISETSAKCSKNLTTSLLKKHIEKFEMTNYTRQKLKNLKRLDLFSLLPLKPKSKSVPVKFSKNKNLNSSTLHKKSKTLYYSSDNVPLNKASAYYTEANARHREYMEDFIKIIDCFPKQGFKEKSLYVVCDGHSGEDVAKITVDRFPQIFKSILNNSHDHEEEVKSYQSIIEGCITQSFRIMDEELVQYEEVGSTINIIFMQFENKERIIYSGNLGDSRSILVKKKEAIRLSYDHKAIDKNEIERVKKDGGIILKKRFYGALAITRALGDYTFKIDGCGLSNIPYISRTIVEKDDQYIIMGSDGIWDVINEEKAYKLIQDNPNIAKDPGLLSKFIVEKAVELGSKDNISCIAIKLN
jgi:serine/threonine protein phosphatase PrpC